jgi:hypothetical protein
LKYVIALWLGAALAALGYGASLTWGSVVTLPGTYAHLRSAGVHVPGRFVDCQRYMGSGRVNRGLQCDISFTLEGVEHTFGYSGSTAGGNDVTVLVDPHHPTTAYTSHDVEYETNAGWGRRAFFGLGIVIFGVLLIGLPILVNKTGD